jgi:oligopeptide transport system permease protein
VVLVGLFGLCIGSLPWTLASVQHTSQVHVSGLPLYNAGDTRLNRLPPSWWPMSDADAHRMKTGLEASGQRWGMAFRLLGTDELGRSVWGRCLVGGAISLTIGVFAASLAVFIGTLYGALAASIGGRVDALMMRIVDVLFGLPTILIVVLLAVASDAVIDEYQSRAKAREAWVDAQIDRQDPEAPSEDMIRANDAAERRAELIKQARDVIPERQLSPTARTLFDLSVLVIAIGSVSWLSMARVVRGQVLSLKARPFMEAARAIGVPWPRVFFRHLLPNLIGTIVVYATLAVPQAILQESFLSFLGIGVKPPLPSWGTLAAGGLNEINPYRSYWWLLVFPCGLLAGTLLLLNTLGESLREALDSRSSRGDRA